MHLLLLEQGDLSRLHAKVGIILQQLLRAIMGVPGCHDHERELCISSCLCLQRQNGLYVHLRMHLPLAESQPVLLPPASAEASSHSVIGT